MKIKLMSELDYNLILNIQKRYPVLTFENIGYQYIDKSKFTEEDAEAFDEVTKLLKEHVIGFSKFNNFQITKDGKVRIRLQYNYGAEDNSMPFTGVGYLLVDELHKGFHVKETITSVPTVKLDDNYETAIHWQPSNQTGNVRCLNGSAHVRASRDKSQVTCTKCLDKDDADQDRFWLKYNC